MAALLGLFMVRVEPEAQAVMLVMAVVELLVDLLGLPVPPPHGVIPVGLELAEAAPFRVMAVVAGVAVAPLTRQTVVAA